jgi:SRSO17 transposase
VPWPLTAQLYLPEAWATEGARRAKVHVPPEGALQTKPALALALGDRARAWGVPCAWVVADAGDGAHPACLLGLAARQLAYGVGVSSSFGGRLPDDGPAAPPPRPRGRGQPKKPRPAPLYTAKGVLAALPADRWQTRTWRAHDDGVLCNQCVAVRVHGATGGPQCSTSPPRVCPGPEGWLLGERPVPGDSGDRQWSCSPQPADTPLRRLVEVAHSRWPLEQFYADAKGGAGIACIAISHWSCSRIACWRASVGRPPTRRALPPSGERPSLPAVHRQVLVGLFQDVVWWLLATNQIAQFRPRRI